MRGARIADRRAAERDIALAHTTASFQRVKELKALEHYLPPRRARGGLPMLDRLKQIAAATAELAG